MTKSPSVVLGFHGCDATFGNAALASGLSLKPSAKSYDWLGPGVYFWENDRFRALEWSQQRVASGKYKQAFVLGAIIDLGNCLDLTLRENVELLAPAYKGLQGLNKASGLPMPDNLDVRSKIKGDKLLRYRDCAVINHLHAIISDPIANPPGNPDYLEPFDTVRGLFAEGRPVYPRGSFYRQSHTQIAVINPKNIIGIFRPHA